MDNSMYASVLTLDRQAVKALRIKDPYSVHRVVYSIFEDLRTKNDKKRSTTSGIVYNDQGGDFKGRQILMVSDRIPASRVNGQYGHVETKTILPSFLTFDAYYFKVTVNPCQRNNQTKKLVPVKGREHIAQWFINRSEQSWGFNAANMHLQVNNVTVLRFKGKNQRNITIAQACLEGVLNVTDREKFIHGFRQGVGRARAFGCGLLQIVPISTNTSLK